MPCLLLLSDHSLKASIWVSVSLRDVVSTNITTSTATLSMIFNCLKVQMKIIFLLSGLSRILMKYLRYFSSMTTLSASMLLKGIDIANSSSWEGLHHRQISPSSKSACLTWNSYRLDEAIQAGSTFIYLISNQARRTFLEFNFCSASIEK